MKIHIAHKVVEGKTPVSRCANYGQRYKYGRVIVPVKEFLKSVPEERCPNCELLYRRALNAQRLRKGLDLLVVPFKTLEGK